MLQGSDETRFRPRVLGHRGASADAPENTVGAYRLAIDQGADGVELDLRVSADGALVLHHDPALDDGRLIHETHRAELPAAMSTLAEALDAVAGASVNIEIKNLPHEPGFEPSNSVTDAVATLLTERGWSDDVIVSSFYVPTIERFKAIVPAVPTAVLSWSPTWATDSIGTATAGGHQAIHPHVDSVTADLIEAAHAQGLVVTTWTLDDPDRAVTLADWGIDGIITNRPATLLGAFGRDDESERVRPMLEGE